MKVSFYISSLTGGGAERVLINLINYLFENGVDVELAVNHKSGPYLSLLNQGVPIHKLKAKNPKHSIFELAEYLNSTTPDVAVSTLYNCNFALILAGKLSTANPKILVREANSFLTKTRYLSRFRALYERLKAKLFYPRADGIFVNSKGSRTELAEVTGIREEDINILPNPLEIGYIREKGREKLPKNIAEFLKKKPYIIAVGRLIKAKGFDTLIKAFRLLPDKECRLVILGEGEKREELQKMINQYGLSKRVLMPGYVKNPYAVMSTASLFVLSSRYEGMPNVLLEAMALELPLVATDCPSGPRELLKDGKFGCLVPVDDELKLSEAINNQIGRSIANKEERNNYIRQFDVEQVGSEFYSLLKSLMG